MAFRYVQRLASVASFTDQISVNQLDQVCEQKKNSSALFCSSSGNPWLELIYAMS